MISWRTFILGLWVGFALLCGIAYVIHKATEKVETPKVQTEIQTEVEVDVPHVQLVNSVEDVDFWFDAINASAMAQYDSIMEIFAAKE